MGCEMRKQMIDAPERVWAGEGKAQFKPQIMVGKAICTIRAQGARACGLHKYTAGPCL
jgi:hypothetical protein